MNLVVKKRSGNFEPIDLSKPERAVIWAAQGLSIDYKEIYNEDSKAAYFYDGIPTSKIQQLLANTAETKISENWDWTYFAARLTLQKVLKEAHGNLPYTTEVAYYVHIRDYLNRVKNECSKQLQFERIYEKFDLDAINDAIKPEKDLGFEMMAITTLADRYLLKDAQDNIIEAPQHFFMRVSMGLALAESKDNATQVAIDLYNAYSDKVFLSSTPTLFNSATTFPQLSSCFVSTMEDDSLDGIFATGKDIGKCSKFSGGTANSMTALRAKDSHIKSTGGKAGGVVPYSKLYEDVVRGFDQGGKRPGVIALYLETWHLDIFDFLNSANPSGDERTSIRDIQLATWIPDLFMERARDDKEWTLFSPNECPDLHEIYGDEFNAAYIAYENNPNIVNRKTVKAKDVWKKILECLFNYKGKGWPCFKDTINKRSMTRDYGVVHSSNLCVSGDTPIEWKGKLDTYIQPIGELENRYVDIWNGEEWSNVQIVKTAEQQMLHLVCVQIQDGLFTTEKLLRCTSYHKFYLENGVEVRCEDLKQNDHLISYIDPHSGNAIEQKVIFIKHNNSVEDTYCFTEHKRHMGLFNGILTGNCTEITLRNSSDRTSVCNLGSVNLSLIKTKAQLEKTIRLGVRAIDNAVTEGLVPIEKGLRFNLEDRPLGLGIMGYTEFLAGLGISYNSYEHVYAADALLEYISYIAIDESSNIGKEKGNFPMFEKSRWRLGELPMDTGHNQEMRDILDSIPFTHSFIENLKTDIDWESLRLKTSLNMRNSTLMAIAPTATIANIAGCINCTELPHDDEYQKVNLSGSFIISSVLKRKYKDTNPSLVLNAKNAGSYFSILAAAARQKWVDQAQSLNVWVSSSIKGKELSDLYMLGWRLGVKTFYYLKSEASESKSIESSGGSGNSTVDETYNIEQIAVPTPAVFCSIDNPDCEACQ